MNALNAAALASLASWIDSKLSNEHADRQTICEDVAGQLRDMAAALRESSPPSPGGWSALEYAEHPAQSALKAWDSPASTALYLHRAMALAETMRALLAERAAGGAR